MALKLKYISNEINRATVAETIHPEIPATDILPLIPERKTIDYTVKVFFELFDPEYTINPLYTEMQRTSSLFEFETEDFNFAFGKAKEYAIQWLKTTFGENNVII